MRWFVRDKYAAEGSRITERKFLWWPVRIGIEYRWLMYAHIEYEYKDVRGLITGSWVRKWVPRCFLD